MRLEPPDLREVVDRCYALYDDYDYAHYFGLEGELSPAEIHRRILADADYQRRLGQ